MTSINTSMAKKSLISDTMPATCPFLLWESQA